MGCFVFDYGVCYFWMLSILFLNFGDFGLESEIFYFWIWNIWFLMWEILFLILFYGCPALEFWSWIFLNIKRVWVSEETKRKFSIFWLALFCQFWNNNFLKFIVRRCTGHPHFCTDHPHFFDVSYWLLEENSIFRTFCQNCPKLHHWELW